MTYILPMVINLFFSLQQYAVHGAVRAFTSQLAS